MRPFLVFFLLLCGTKTIAADGVYTVSSINPALLKNANVIKRSEEVRFTIHNLKNTTLVYKYALTILNEKGDKHGYFVEWYDKLREITSIEGNLYDATGKKIKSLKGKEIQDVSAVDDISLMDDNRKKVHSFYHKIYPYTIEYAVSIKYNHSFQFPGWMPQDAEYLAVEKSSFSVIYPAEYVLRYKMLNYIGEPQQLSDKQTRTFLWQVKDQPAIFKEQYAPGWNELTTNVSIAPTLFELEGYRGNMTSWQEFGKFIYELGKGRTLLPTPVKEKVAQLISNAKNDKEKVKILYDYLQQNTRYISIQLGLGGWQPFTAEYVARKGYGDCKALSNYMQSLLLEAKVPSLYTLIKAGENSEGIMEEFPSTQFNHAILCVPLQNDTVWLECTSQTNPYGYMGGFTGNRKALVITEDGGKIVNTPKYTIINNIQKRIAEGKVDEGGGLSTKSKTMYEGLQQDNLHGMIHQLSKDKIKEILQGAFELPTYHIQNFNYHEQKKEQPYIIEDIDLYAANYATITGKRMFITPNVFNRSGSYFPPEEIRLQDILINYEYKDIDSVTIEIPEGYEPEAIPNEVNLKSEFGSYKSNVKISGNQINYVRIREQYKGRYPLKKYESLAAYFSAIKKADKRQIVFVKKQ